MITIVFGKPNKSIQVIGYGVDSYKDKEGKEIWRVYGIVTPASRGRLASRESNVIKDIYMDETTVVIFRASERDDANRCKEAIDKSVANKFPVFSVDVFKEWLNEQKKQDDDGVVVRDNVN